MRAHGTGNVRQLDSGSWHGRIRLPSGDRFSYTHPHKRTVERKLHEARLKAEAGRALPDPTMKLSAWLDRWLDDIVRPHKEPRTYEVYEQYARLYIRPALGDKKLARLAAADVQAMLNGMQKRGLSAQTMVHARAVLRQALNAAMRWDIIDRNVATLVELPPPEPHTVRPLTAEDARKVLAAVKGTRLGCLVLVAMALGLRQEEVLGLTWEAVNFEREEIRIEKVLVRSRERRDEGGSRIFELRLPKTPKSRRTIPVPAVIVSALCAHKERQLHEGARLGHDAGIGRGLVFPSANGAPLDGSDVTHRFQNALVRAGLPHMRFHDLRHGAASFLLSINAPPHVAMRILGHSNPKITLDIYAHANDTEVRKAMDEMGKLLGGG